MIKPYIEQLHLRGGKVVPEELSPINENNRYDQSC